ncbi:PH domain-containing protein [Lactobacillaceae bacterium Scapto_B20]
MQSLPKRVQRVWFFSALFSFSLWLVALIAYAVARHWLTWLPTVGIWIILALAIAWVVIETALIPYRYRFYHFAVNEFDVEIQKGFFFRHHVSIPIARVQNVDLNQGPLLTMQHLFEVSIATGGSVHHIDALTKEHAEQLKDRVMKLALEARNAQ